MTFMNIHMNIYKNIHMSIYMNIRINIYMNLHMKIFMNTQTIIWTLTNVNLIVGISCIYSQDATFKVSSKSGQ